MVNLLVITDPCRKLKMLIRYGDEEHNVKFYVYLFKLLIKISPLSKHNISFNSPFIFK